MKFSAAVFVFLFTASACAQSAETHSSHAHILFKFENPRLQPAVYSLEIYEDGTGSYMASTGGAGSQGAGRAIAIHDPLLSHLFEVARAHHFFAIACEAPHRHVAFTGKKTLAYAGPDGEGSCTFNYSREQTMNQIAADFMSVAYTLQEGARLKSEHLHDRLALDSELESLQDAVKDGQALELENIAPELGSIANDDAVMNLARKRAQALLIEPAALRQSSNE